MNALHLSPQQVNEILVEYTAFHRNEIRDELDKLYDIILPNRKNINRNFSVLAKRDSLTELQPLEKNADGDEEVCPLDIGLQFSYSFNLPDPDGTKGRRITVDLYTPIKQLKALGPVNAFHVAIHSRYGQWFLELRDSLSPVSRRQKEGAIS